MKWRNASEVWCDPRISMKLNAKFYEIVKIPTMLYGTECSVIKMQHVETKCENVKVDKWNNER